MRHLRARKDLIEVCQALERHHLNQGTSGNASCRAGETVLITPSGVDYARMRPGDVVEIDRAGQVVDGPLRPSSEWRFHVDILAARADVHAVLHVHAPYSTGLACTGQGIPPFHYMVAVAGGRDIRCAPYETFGSQALSDVAIDALVERKACLLANHGMIALGTNIFDALRIAIEVETLAAQLTHARKHAEPLQLSEQEMCTVLAKFRSYGQDQESE